MKTLMPLGLRMIPNKRHKTAGTWKGAQKKGPGFYHVVQRQPQEAAPTPDQATSKPEIKEDKP